MSGDLGDKAAHSCPEMVAADRGDGIWRIEGRAGQWWLVETHSEMIDEVESDSFEYMIAIVFCPFCGERL